MVYYHERLDILCIVEGKKIWKFLGDFCDNPMIELIADKNTWYKAEVSPEVFTVLPDKGGWDLIYE